MRGTEQRRPRILNESDHPYKIEELRVTQIGYMTLSNLIITLF
jgi:hypothetical protein